MGSRSRDLVNNLAARKRGRLQALRSVMGASPTDPRHSTVREDRGQISVCGNEAMDVDEVLGIEELRARLLVHSRHAFRLLPPLRRPRILDIGCGKGQQTLELARLGAGEVTGIDVDESALAELRRRIDEADLGDRVTAVHVSLFDNGFSANSFDVLWEEGVLHLLDPTRSLRECWRLLKPDGHLVMHETVTWFEAARDQVQRCGFDIAARHLLPRRFWWTEYGAPLEARIQSHREALGEAAGGAELAAHEEVVAAIKRDPDGTNCGIYLLRKPV